MIEEKKFKVTETNAKDAPTKDIEWEGEEVQAYSDTKLTDDIGKGTPVIIRVFEFGANIEAFRQHKPSPQELFDSHKKGIESLLWTDGLTSLQGVEPRLIFSKNQQKYRFFITCTPTETLLDNPKTLTELLAK